MVNTMVNTKQLKISLYVEIQIPFTIYNKNSYCCVRYMYESDATAAVDAHVYRDWLCYTGRVTEVT